MGHGSMYHRRPGSMGSTSTPGRVFKGKKLPGHMGRVTVTIQNLDVVRVDINNGLLSIQTSRFHETLFEREDSTPHMLKIRSAKIRDKFSFLMLCSSYGF